MKILYGKSSALKYITEDYKIFNFNSSKEIGIPMNLYPPNSLGSISEYDFDCKYAQYIMNNDFMFSNLMNFIMCIYNRMNIFILINDDEESFFNPDMVSWNLILIESFLKFIQQRYGLNATYVNEYEDIIESNDVEFADYGIMNLDIDKERWTYLMEYNRIIINGEKPYA